MDPALAHARCLIRSVCDIAGSINFVGQLQDEMRRDGVVEAVETHDTGAIFDWLMRALSFQGISDAVAYGYMKDHGSATLHDVGRSFARRPTCPKLQGYWTFHDCRYEKGSQTCAEPDHFPICPLPRHALRNGRLNQTAYSLFLFIRDVAKGDIVDWIDQSLSQKDLKGSSQNLSKAREAIVGPLRHVFGISDKMVMMAMSSLMIGVARLKPHWFEVGSSFVVVDTLVHNFLHRTGILRRFGADHLYGPRCYRVGGCEDILTRVAAGIDARVFNPSFPKVFPRFIQNAVWQFCAGSSLDICNGNTIDDRKRCVNASCQLHNICDRVVLGRTVKKGSKIEQNTTT